MTVRFILFYPLFRESDIRGQKHSHEVYTFVVYLSCHPPAKLYFRDIWSDVTSSCVIMFFFLFSSHAQGLYCMFFCLPARWMKPPQQLSFISLPAIPRKFHWMCLNLIFSRLRIGAHLLLGGLIRRNLLREISNEGLRWSVFRAFRSSSYRLQQCVCVFLVSRGTGLIEYIKGQESCRPYLFACCLRLV